MTAIEAPEGPRERVLRRLANEFEFYAPRALKIIDKQAHEVPFTLKPAQVRLARQLEAQRAAGQPMRACALKARQVGISTEAQGLVIQRTTTRANHKARIVSLDIEGAGALYKIGEFMYDELPDDIRPPAAYKRDGLRDKFMQFANPSAAARRGGARGLNSSIAIDTQKSPAAGRGQTFRTMHLSEVAFWEQWSKVTALLNTVPDDADTLVIVESTAKGLNAFYAFWQACEMGNGFIPFFTPWFEEQAYRRPFFNADERAEFETLIGKPMPGQRQIGEEEEPALIDLMRERFADWRVEGIHPREELGEAEDAVEWTRILEHLYWRRWAIRSKHDSKLDDFHQENPSTAEEAFLSTGRSVFDRGHLRRARARVQRVNADPATAGIAGALVAVEHKRVVTRMKSIIQVPTKVEWVPGARLPVHERARARWMMWEHPSSGSQFVIGVDPESGEENEGQTAAHGIEIVNHRTLEQAAEWASDAHDADEMALEAYKAAIYFNEAWVGIEKTGGWGLSTLRYFARDVRYPRTYRTSRKDVGVPNEFDDTLGWSTDSVSKPLMRDRGRQLLREETDGIRSADLIMEMTTYVQDERGRMNPEPGKRSDRLMAWLIAQMIAQEKPPRRERAAGSSSSTTGGQWSPRTVRGPRER